jgi:hypothetical protein
MSLVGILVVCSKENSMSRKNSPLCALPLAGLLWLGGAGAGSPGLPSPRLFDLMPASVRAWLAPSPAAPAPGRHTGRGPIPTKCGITIDPNGCPSLAPASCTPCP